MGGMERVLVLLGAAAGAVLLGLANRFLQRRWRAWIAHEATRYGTRAEVPGDGPVVIGTSLEDAGAEGTPSSSPTLESVEAVLDDGNGRPLRLPAGIPLRVRAFEGARRVALESITGSAGTRTRYTFEVPKNVFFWILDAEGDRPEGPTGELRIAARSDGYELTTGVPPVPGDLERHAKAVRWPMVFFALTALATFVPQGSDLAQAWVTLLIIGGLRLAWRGIELTDVPDLPAGVPRVLEEDPGMQAKWVLFPRPLWTQKMLHPDSWLFAGKRAGPRVLVYDLGDPHAIEGIDPRDDLVAGVACLLADAVWLGTDLPATACAPAVVGRQRVQRTRTETTWQTVASSVADEGGRTVVVFGDARPDLSKEGFDLRFRTSEPPGVEEGTVSGALPGLSRALVERLVARGLCSAASPPFGFALPAPDVVDLYLRVHDVLLLAVMMSPDNGYVSPAGPGWYDRTVDLAAELADRAPGLVQARLCWYAAAIHAHLVGKLTADRRQRVLADVRRAVDPEDPIHRLSPALFARLGEAEEARARLKTLGDGASGPYRGEPTAYGAWLREVEESLPPAA